MPTAVSNASSVKYMPLKTPSNMGAALKTALDIGYRGVIHAYNQNGNDTWRIELNGPGNRRPVTATLGDVFVWHPESAYLESMSSDKFDQLFTATSSSAATGQPVMVTYLVLSSAADMGTAIDLVSSLGYSAQLVPDGDWTWRLELDGGAGNFIRAVIGEVLVVQVEARRVETMTADRFAELYTAQ